ncbi:MAG: ribosomal RNA small subunit methyltransferase A [Candidatus Kapabacteria bacterium]|nr:ribosomal RNA small subunit methyltransferase A [Ignavibacteriota bacterium]MCW5886197.1 ribosomal RNA small subunit methyltransferase A [Candidatus Kapabacteria bacterium]
MNLKSIKPNKSLGQNFLIDRNIAAKTVKIINADENSYVIEIGPGTGALTSLLLETNCNLTAIEIDERAFLELSEKYPKEKYPKFNLMKMDFRDFDFYGIGNNLKVIGNIPYYLSSEIFFKLFEATPNIELAVMTIQKEVAKRLTSKRGSKDFGILTLAMMMSGTCKIEFDVPPACFYPAPNVMSSVIKMDFKNIPNPVNDYKKIMKIIRLAFSQRRKMLSNSIKDYLNNIQIDASSPEFEKYSQYLTRRPEELLPEDFEYLLNIIESYRKQN